MVLLSKINIRVLYDSPFPSQGLSVRRSFLQRCLVLWCCLLGGIESKPGVKLLPCNSPCELFAARSRSHKIPARGQKEFFPNDSEQQKQRLEQSLEEHWSLISEERVERL